MEDIRVGEYIRTESGYIGKIEQINKEPTDENITYVITDVHSCFLEEVVKHSSDILDLIEVRDFINGLRILDLERKEDRIFACIAKIGPKEYWQTFCKEDIIDIVTKEQFEHERYIVGG